MSRRRFPVDLGCAGLALLPTHQRRIPMIDFANSTIVKLKPSHAGEDVVAMLIEGEEV